MRLLTVPQIEQDDAERKSAGIRSLRGYAAACDTLLIPCKQRPGEIRDIDQLPGDYGARAWTRLEALTFFAVSSLSPVGRQHIFACADGEPLFLEQYTYDLDPSYLPSEGDLFDLNDADVIEEHEEAMLAFMRDGLHDPEVVVRCVAKNLLKGRGLGEEHAASMAEAAELIRRGGTFEWDCTELSASGTYVPAGTPVRASRLCSLSLAPARPAPAAERELSHDAGNDMGDHGAKVIAAAMGPRRNPDSTYEFNRDIRGLNLESALPFCLSSIQDSHALTRLSRLPGRHSTWPDQGTLWLCRRQQYRS